MADPQRKHALLSPSSASQWLKCHAAPAAQLNCPDQTSPYAAEGTRKHTAGELVLRHRCESLQDLLDDEGYLFDAPVEVFPRQYQLDESGERIFCDDDFILQVDAYARAVRTYQPYGALFLEQRLPIGSLTGEDGAEGTADAVIVGEDEITIIDAKFGRLPVRPERNTQLMMYWLAATEHFALMGEFTKGRLVISQPSISLQPLEWTFERIQEPEGDDDGEAAEELRQEITIASRHALTLIASAAEGQTLNELHALTPRAFSPGEVTCQWCRAKAKCPAYEAFVKSVVDDGQPGFTDLASKGRYAQFVIDWGEAVLKDIAREVLAGNTVPGFKAVLGREGNRQWADENVAERYLKQSIRLKDSNMYSRKLISPTRALMLVTDSELKTRKLEAMIVRKPAQLCVVKDEDPRQQIPVSPSSIEDDFTVAPNTAEPQT